jgi:hypothetical protein
MSTTQTAVKCLRPVPGGNVTIAPCKGSRLVSTSTAVFAAYISPDFVDFKADGPGPDTPPTPALVSDLVEDAPFAEMFGEDSFTPSQMVQFCENHANLLSHIGATFIPIICDGSRFVARVLVYGRELEVHVDLFSFDFVWDTGFAYRIVRPQMP